MKSFFLGLIVVALFVWAAIAGVVWESQTVINNVVTTNTTTQIAVIGQNMSFQLSAVANAPTSSNLNVVVQGSVDKSHWVDMFTMSMALNGTTNATCITNFSTAGLVLLRPHRYWFQENNRTATVSLVTHGR